MAVAKKNIAALNDAITIRVPNDSVATPSFQLPAAWAGTVVLEATDNDIDWVTLGITPAAGGAAVLLAAAAGLWNGPAGAYTQIRLRVSVAGAGGIAALNVASY